MLMFNDAILTNCRSLVHVLCSYWFVCEQGKVLQLLYPQESMHSEEHFLLKKSGILQ